MDSEELNKIGEWLNTKGYGIDLSDDFWMEEYDWGEHKTRDIAKLLFDYHAEQCNIADVVEQSEQFYCVADKIGASGDCKSQCESCKEVESKQ